MLAGQGIPVAAPLALFATVMHCLAVASGRSLQFAADNSDRHRRGLAGVLHFATYLLMALSTALLLVSVAAVVQMPRPRCLCYTVPFSDSAVCIGRPLCSCTNLRQANGTLVLLWNLLLMCELAVGIEVTFVFPFLGFFSLHILIIVLLHMLVRTYSRQSIMAAEADQAQRLRNALGSLDPRIGASGSHAATAAPPPIDTMSAELVLVLQPDYLCRHGDGVAGHGSGGQWCGGDADANADADGGADGDGDGKAAGDGGSGGIAWALRYTRIDSLAAGLKPPAQSPKAMSRAGGGNGTGGDWGTATISAGRTWGPVGNSINPGVGESVPELRHEEERASLRRIPTSPVYRNVSRSSLVPRSPHAAGPDSGGGAGVGVGGGVSGGEDGNGAVTGTPRTVTCMRSRSGGLTFNAGSGAVGGGGGVGGCGGGGGGGGAPSAAAGSSARPLFTIRSVPHIPDGLSPLSRGPQRQPTQPA